MWKHITGTHTSLMCLHSWTASVTQATNTATWQYDISLIHVATVWYLMDKCSYHACDKLFYSVIGCNEICLLPCSICKYLAHLRQWSYGSFLLLPTWVIGEEVRWRAMPSQGLQLREGLWTLRYIRSTVKFKTDKMCQRDLAVCRLPQLSFI